MKHLWYTALFVIAALVFACGTAKADPLDSYVTDNGPSICHKLDRDGTTLRVFDNIAATVEIDGEYTQYEAGRIIGRAVQRYCPWNYQPLADLMTPVGLA